MRGSGLAATACGCRHEAHTTRVGGSGGPVPPAETSIAVEPGVLAIQ